MQESRSKNSSRNILWGIINKTITLILPFVTRTLTLYLLGANFLGIGTLFNSILSFLSLTELGLGSAIVYSMYRPIAENDNDTICAILNYYKKLYRIIGIVMLVIGTILLPFIPYLISKGAPNNINIYILYYIYLVNSVISYFFSGYRSSLLIAHQRTDISTKLLIATNIFVQLGQIMTLCLTKNFYAYAFIPIIGTTITNILYKKITKQMFPNIEPYGIINPDIRYDIKRKISGLMGTKLNSIVVHSADTIVISSFLGLTLTAQYGNYYQIFNAVCGFVGVLYASITASIGNKLVSDSLDENYQLFKNLSFLNMWIVCFCCTCLMCLYEPFMNFWVGEDLALGFKFTIIMVIYFFVYQIQKTILTFKDAAGLWYADRYRPYVSMLINISSNLILVHFIGIYGIVLSTIIAFLISLPWANKVLFVNLFKRNHLIHLLEIFKYFIITGVISFFTYMICGICTTGIVGILERLLLCIVLTNSMLVLFNYNQNEFKYWKNFCVKIFLKKVKKC